MKKKVNKSKNRNVFVFELLKAGNNPLACVTDQGGDTGTFKDSSVCNLEEGLRVFEVRGKSRQHGHVALYTACSGLTLYL